MVYLSILVIVLVTSPAVNICSHRDKVIYFALGAKFDSLFELNGVKQPLPQLLVGEGFN